MSTGSAPERLVRVVPLKLDPTEEEMVYRVRALPYGVLEVHLQHGRIQRFEEHRSIFPGDGEAQELGGENLTNS